MRVRIAPAVLLQELKVLRAIQDKADGIKITATDLGLSIEGPNSDTRITTTISAFTLVEPGYVQAPRGKLTEIVNAMSCEDFALSSEDERLVIVDEQAEFRAKLIRPTLMQSPVGLSVFTHTVQTDAAALLDLIRVTRHALPLSDMSSDGRSGLQLVFNGTTQKALALDGRALALHRVSTNDGGEGVLTLHRRAVRYISALLEDASGPVTMQVSDRGLVVTAGHRTLQTPLQSIVMPNCDALFSQVLPTEAVVPRVGLLSSIRRVMALAEPAESAVDLTINAESIDVAFGQDAKDTLAATSNVTDPVTVRLAAGYLINALGAAGTETVQLRAGKGLVKLSTEHSDFLIAPMIIRT